MRLSYRGVQYTPEQTTLEITEGEILGKYRGTNWRCKTLREVPVPQPNFSLRYRGVAYNTSQTIGNPVCVNQAASNCLDKPLVIPNTLSAKEIARIHYANLQRNLERRLQVARQRGDQTLINLLEAESKQLV